MRFPSTFTVVTMSRPRSHHPPRTNSVKTVIAPKNQPNRDLILIFRSVLVSCSCSSPENSKPEYGRGSASPKLHKEFGNMLLGEEQGQARGFRVLRQGKRKCKKQAGIK